MGMNAERSAVISPHSSLNRAQGQVSFYYQVNASILNLSLAYIVYRGIIALLPLVEQYAEAVNTR